MKINWMKEYRAVEKAWCELNKMNKRYQKERFDVLKFLHHLAEDGKLKKLTRHQLRKFNTIIRKIQR